MKTPLLLLTLFSALFSTHSLALSSDDMMIDEVQQAQFAREDKVAILVGIERYDSEKGLTELEYTVDDMVLLERELSTLGFTIIKFLSGSAQGAVYASNDIKPTKRRIVDTLQGLKGAFQKNSGGTVLFAFSGHGFADKSENNYLATLDTDAGNLSRTGLKVSDVKRMLKETNARQQLVFLDACRNLVEKGQKNIAQSNLSAFSGRQFDNAEGMGILFSTGFSKYSFERDNRWFEKKDLELLDDANGGQGLFTYALIKGLRGAAKNEQGFITFRSLSDYVQTQVPKWTNYGQKPFSAGEFRGDFLLAVEPVETTKSNVNGVVIAVAGLLVAAVVGFIILRRTQLAGAIGGSVSPSSTSSAKKRADFIVPQQVSDASAIGYLCKSSNRNAIYPIHRGGEAIVGRDASTADVVISDDAVSSMHAAIGWDAARKVFWVEDRNSSNGTWVNERRIEPGQRVVLKSKDKVAFAKKALTYFCAQND